MNNDAFTYSIATFLVWGVIWGAISILAIVVLFGWAGREVMKEGKKLAVWLILSLATPIALNMATQQIRSAAEARTKPKILALEIADAGEQAILSLQTDKPAILYLEIKKPGYDNWIPVLPTTDLKLRTDHAFLCLKEMLEWPIVVNANGMELPLELPKSDLYGR